MACNTAYTSRRVAFILDFVGIASKSVWDPEGSYCEIRLNMFSHNE